MFVSAKQMFWKTVYGETSNLPQKTADKKDDELTFTQNDVLTVLNLQTRTSSSSSSSSSSATKETEAQFLQKLMTAAALTQAQAPSESEKKEENSLHAAVNGIKALLGKNQSASALTSLRQAYGHYETHKNLQAKIRDIQKLKNIMEKVVSSLTEPNENTPTENLPIFSDYKTQTAVILKKLGITAEPALVEQTEAYVKGPQVGKLDEIKRKNQVVIDALKRELQSSFTQFNSISSLVPVTLAEWQDKLREAQDELYETAGNTDLKTDIKALIKNISKLEAELQRQGKMMRPMHLVLQEQAESVLKAQDEKATAEKQLIAVQQASLLATAAKVRTGDDDADSLASGMSSTGKGPVNMLEHLEKVIAAKAQADDIDFYVLWALGAALRDEKRIRPATGTTMAPSFAGLQQTAVEKELYAQAENILRGNKTSQAVMDSLMTDHTDWAVSQFFAKAIQKYDVFEVKGQSKLLLTTFNKGMNKDAALAVHSRVLRWGRLIRDQNSGFPYLPKLGKEFKEIAAAIEGTSAYGLGKTQEQVLKK